MSNCKNRVIYLNGDPVPVTEEVYLEWYRPIWRTHDFARRHGQCSCHRWQLCEGDCAICRFRTDGDLRSLDDLQDSYELESALSGDDPEGLVLDAILLDELLDELDQRIPNGRRIAELLMNGLDDRSAAEALGIARSTFSDRKLKLRRELKMKYEKNFF
jgi:hypothetical protein